MAWLAHALPAHAQLAGRVSLDSDYRHRGYSLTDGNPALSGTLSYDHESGIYASGLVIIAPDRSRIGLAGFQANLGYASRIGRLVSVETGLLRTEYARAPGEALSLRYTEAYVGIARGGLAARAYYSSDYIRRGRRTLYSEVEVSARPVPGWKLNAHLGALTYLGDPPPYAADTRIDWRATASRDVGPVELHASLSGRGSGGDYYVRTKGRAVVTAGVSLVF